MLKNKLPDELKKYLIISAALHVIIFIIFMCNLLSINSQKKNIFTEIDMSGVANVSSPKNIKQNPKVKNKKNVEKKSLKKEEKKSPKVIEKKEEKIPQKESKKEDSLKVKENKKTPPKKPDISQKKKEKNVIKDAVKKIEKQDKRNKLKNIVEKHIKTKGSFRENNASEGDEDMFMDENVQNIIREQISSHWIVPAGIKDAENFIIDIKIELAENGSISSIKIVDNDRYLKDPGFRSAADSARLAVLEASPLQIPKKDINKFRSFVFRFDVKEAMNR